ncbi:MAG TPA: TetR/AcrR family transcriptional regulator [Anaerolineaceae bacterium]|jgi:AcrR family transcriptional regulator|nr:TetR/AcrR family transcriptional regulator [Anaerolineaceae bacterium]
MARKDDRRIQRTRKALRDALHSLVLDRGYDDLSVQDITDKANLGRATFYLHYREKDELLEDLLREFSESFAQRYGSKVNYADRKVVQAMFEYAENHYDFYRIMTIGKGGLAGIRKLRAILQESYSQFLDGIETEAGGKFGVPRDFLDSYQANAIMSTIFLWLEQDMPYPPAEMADMYLKLASPARLSFSVSSDEPVIDKQKAKNNKASKQAAATEQTLTEVYPQAEKENTNGNVDIEDVKE